MFFADTFGGSPVFDDKFSGDHSGRKKTSCGVWLSQILPDSRFIACDDIIAMGCHDDPARCGPGDVFVARLTAHGDGHEEVARAIARGVSGIVAERMVPTFGTPLCLIADSGSALTRIAHALAGNPATAMRVIAITGTSGKTTTAWLTAAVLSEAGLRVGILSDLGCLAADSTEPLAADLAQPLVLAAWLGQLAASGCTHAVVEVSSRMLAERALAGIACDTVVVTNLSTAHLDLHSTKKSYHTIKSSILESLGENGCLIAGVDDKHVQRLCQRNGAARPGCAMITAGLSVTADLSASPIERSLYGQTFLLRASGGMVPIAVTTPVASFVRNAMLAAAIGLRYRVPLERIARGIEAAGSVAGRMERLDRGQEFSVFLDQPTSNHALRSTLCSLRKLTQGRLILIADEQQTVALSGDAQRQRSKLNADKQFAFRASRWCDECLVVSSGMLEDDADAQDVADYARIDRLLSSLNQYDCLLVLGKSLSAAGGPTDPLDGILPLAAVIDGWLQLAHPPQCAFPQRSSERRRAA